MVARLMPWLSLASRHNTRSDKYIAGSRTYPGPQPYKLGCSRSRFQFHTAVLMTLLTLCWTGLIDMTHAQGCTGCDSVVLVVIASSDCGLIVAWKFVLVCRP